MTRDPLTPFALAAALVGLAELAGAEAMPPLQRGDVIFQTSLSEQSLAISLATQSPFTHVGIVDLDPKGELVVLEAVQTTRATPLADWIARGDKGDVAVYRLEALTDAEALAVTDAARTHFGKPYDPHFHASEDRLYCSELVQIAFRDGAGIALGREQALQDLNLSNAAALALVSARWDSHPDCRGGLAADAAACLALIRDDLLITPQAQSEDRKLTLIYSSFDG